MNENKDLSQGCDFNDTVKKIEYFDFCSRCSERGTDTCYNPGRCRHMKARIRYQAEKKGLEVHAPEPVSWALGNAIVIWNPMIELNERRHYIAFKTLECVDEIIPSKIDNYQIEVQIATREDFETPANLGMPTVHLYLEFLDKIARRPIFKFAMGIVIPDDNDTWEKEKNWFVRPLMDHLERALVALVHLAKHQMDPRLFDKNAYDRIILRKDRCNQDGTPELQL